MSSVCPICGASGTEGSSSVCPIASQWADEERMAFLTSYPSPDDTSAREQIIAFWSKAVTHAFECAPSLAMELRILAHGSLAWLGSTSPGIGLATARMLSKDELILRHEVEVSLFQNLSSSYPIELSIAPWNKYKACTDTKRAMTLLVTCPNL